MYPGGTWYNELGSDMTLNVSGNSVWGTYYSAVGDTNRRYDLAGKINPDPSPSGQALGWTVAWTNVYRNANSATSWSGQYQTIDSDEEIVALWLLTSETAPERDWASTRVGKDVFTRTPPSPEEIEASRRRVPPSHPADA